MLYHRQFPNPKLSCDDHNHIIIIAMSTRPLEHSLKLSYKNSFHYLLAHTLQRMDIRPHHIILMKTTKTSSQSRAVCLRSYSLPLKKKPSQVPRTSPYLQFKPTWIETEISTMLYRQVSDLTTHWLLFLERKMCHMSQANYCTLEEKKNQQTDRQTDRQKDEKKSSMWNLNWNLQN